MNGSENCKSKSQISLNGDIAWKNMSHLKFLFEHTRGWWSRQWSAVGGTGGAGVRGGRQETHKPVLTWARAFSKEAG